LIIDHLAAGRLTLTTVGLLRAHLTADNHIGLLTAARHFAPTARPRQSRKQTEKGRHIPASVKRVVWERDGGRCTFVGTEGRCTETGCLEYHHLMPYAHGGPADATNLTPPCRAHNAYDARLVFGDGGPWQSRAASR
jgi:hypothetical protein